MFHQQTDLMIIKLYHKIWSIDDLDCISHLQLVQNQSDLPTLECDDHESKLYQICTDTSLTNLTHVMVMIYSNTLPADNIDCIQNTWISWEPVKPAEFLQSI